MQTFTASIDRNLQGTQEETCLSDTDLQNLADWITDNFKNAMNDEKQVKLELSSVIEDNKEKLKATIKIS